MKQMSEFMNEAFNDMRGAIDKASQEPRKYNKTSDNVYKPQKARFKLAIYGKNGLNRYYYSYDNKTFEKKFLTDEYEGLMKLLRLVNKNLGSFKFAVIYCCIDNEKLTENVDYSYQICKIDITGKVTSNNKATFKNFEKNVFLDVEYLKMYGSKKI